MPDSATPISTINLSSTPNRMMDLMNTLNINNNE